MEPTIEERMNSLLYYVPTGTTEGEKHILREAFVQAAEYAEIITPPSGSPRLLVGKKGSGKSAILDFTINFLKEANVPVLLVKPMDLDLTAMPENGASGELTRIAYDALLRAIASNIGAQLDGYLTGSNEELYREAVAAGERDLDRVGKITRLMSKLAAPLTGGDLAELLPNTDKISLSKLEKATRENIEQSSGAFYLLFDDTDQVASPGTRGHLNRIWAFLLAVRELTSRLDKVRCIVSLRDEIWRELSNESIGQRDQWDHFLRLVYLLNPDLDHVQKIFERRLVLAAERLGLQAKRPPYDLFFEGERPRMPTSTKRSSWPDIVRTRSRERPRDAIQLVNMLAKKAIAPPTSLITENTLALVMPTYSEERAKLLAQEFEKECPSLLQIIRTFARVEYDKGSFLATSELMRKHLLSLPSSFSINLEGEVLNPDSELHVFHLWSFLFSIGFVFPRVSDKRESDNYRFITANEEPDFVNERRWNDMQKALWEVHPVYRDYLIAAQKDEAAQFGLPTKRKPPRHR